MKVEIRNNQVTINGYVNVALRDSKRLASANGEFVEQIEKGAFADALNRAEDVQFLFNHKEDRNLGSIKTGNVKLTEDSVGLRIEATVSDAEVVQEARSGKLTGFSFGFRKLADRFEEAGNGIQRRFIESMDLLEVSLLNTVPAYNDMTLEVRSEGEVELRFIESIIDMEEVVTMTPEERQLLQEKAELAEQRSEEATKRLAEIELELQKLTKKDDVIVENRFETMEYRQAFVNHLVGRASQEQRDMLAGDNGVVIPTTIQAQIERKLIELSPIRGLVRVIGSASNMQIAIDATGATATWVAEGSPISDQNPTLGQVNLDAYKLASMIKLSREIIADSVVAIESYVADLIAEAIATAEGDAFINGVGTTQPTGLVTGLTPTAGTLDYDGLVDIFMSLPNSYRNNANFLVAEDVYTLMLKLVDTAGRPLLQMSTDGISGAPVASVLGKRVVVEPNLASGLLVFADFKRAYIIVDRQGLQVERSSERYFEEDMVAIKVTKRTDGKRLNADALKFYDVIA